MVHPGLENGGWGLAKVLPGAWFQKLYEMYFQSIKQEVRVEGIETQPLGRSQSREGFLGCSKALT